MKKTDYRYPIKYVVEKGSFSREELDGAGGADAIVIVSVMRDGASAHQGAVSYRTISCDGTAEGPLSASEIPSTEMFSIMAMWAKNLAEDKKLASWQQEICADFFHRVRKRVVGPRVSAMGF